MNIETARLFVADMESSVRYLEHLVDVVAPRRGWDDVLLRECEVRAALIRENMNELRQFVAEQEALPHGDR